MAHSGTRRRINQTSLQLDVLTYKLRNIKGYIMKIKKQVLTVGKNSTTQKYFIMGDKKQIPDTPYFNNIKECSIAIFKMNNKEFTNIYNMSDKNYKEYTK